MGNDQILFLKGFVPRDKCDDLIKSFESSPEKMEEGKIGFANVDPSKKKCVESFFDFEDINQHNLVNEYLPLAIEKYREKCISVELWTLLILILYIKYKDIIQLKHIIFYTVKIHIHSQVEF